MYESYQEKKLKIGIYFSQPPKSGGGNTAELTYFQQIYKATETANKLVILIDNFQSQIKEDYANLEEIHVYQNKIKKIYDYLANSYLIALLSNYFHKSFYSFFEKKLIKNEIDLVISLGINPMVNGLKKIPFVTFVWDLGHIDLPIFFEITGNNKILIRERLLKTHILKSRAVFVESEIGKRNIENHYKKNSDQILVTPFVPNLLNTQDTGYLPTHDYVIYPAQFWPHKNHEVLLRALKLLINQGKKPKKLILTGTDKGNLTHIKQIINKLGIKNFCDIKGFVKHEELVKLYREASALLMPSLLGPTNFPPLEALIYGTPVYASKIEGYDSRVKPYMNYIAPFDVESWASVLNADMKPDRIQPNDVITVLAKIEKKNQEIFKMVITQIAKELQLNSGFKS